MLNAKNAISNCAIPNYHAACNVQSAISAYVLARFSRLVTMDMKRAISESAKDLGYEKLKEKQQEAVTLFIQGNDTFVSLPTGYGKSVIYAILPGAFDKYRGILVFIVSGMYYKLDLNYIGAGSWSKLTDNTQDARVRSS